MTFGSTFGRVFSPTFQPKSQAAATASSWWLAGGIAAANCVAAYQPKGAASLAASYINLANPGTNDAYAGTAPNWDSTNGWKFLTANSQYLRNGISSSNTLTVIVRFSNASVDAGTYGGLLVGGGEDGSGNMFAIRPIEHKFIDKRDYIFAPKNYTWFQVAGGATSGVLALNKNFGYLNGVEDVSITNTLSSTTELYIGSGNWGGANGFINANIQSIAYYDNKRLLTTAEVAAVSTAMAAL